jgi:hypothetical protein
VGRNLPDSSARREARGKSTPAFQSRKQDTRLYVTETIEKIDRFSAATVATRRFGPTFRCTKVHNMCARQTTGRHYVINGTQFAALTAWLKVNVCIPEPIALLQAELTAEYT